ncbi:MAG: DUF6883 domain-containing protein [cyanobacterium endosymbiont of Rhopalodia sterrenbergii]
MKFPNREIAYVQDSKLTVYLLPRTHRHGKCKAKLLDAIEFDKANIYTLTRYIIECIQAQKKRARVYSSLFINLNLLLSYKYTYKHL